MTNETFMECVKAQFDVCLSILEKKRIEYEGANQNRLDQIKRQSVMNNTVETSVVWELGSKHLTSLAEMVKNPRDYSEDIWKEKLQDAINYLFILTAVLTEGGIYDPRKAIL